MAIQYNRIDVSLLPRNSKSNPLWADCLIDHESRFRIVNGFSCRLLHHFLEELDIGSECRECHCLKWSPDPVTLDHLFFSLPFHFDPSVVVNEEMSSVTGKKRYRQFGFSTLCLIYNCVGREITRLRGTSFVDEIKEPRVSSEVWKLADSNSEPNLTRLHC